MKRIGGNKIEAILGAIAIITIALNFIASEGIAGVITKEIEFKESDLIFSKYDGYDVVSFKDATSMMEIGSPSLPQRGVKLLIPAGATATKVEIVSYEKQIISGEFNILPAQPPVKISTNEVPEFVEPNPEVYASNEPYPSKLLSDKIHNGTKCQYRIADFFLYTLQYIPAEKRLILYTKVEFRVHYKEGEYTVKGISQGQKELFGKNVESMVINKQDIERWAPPVKASKGLYGDWEMVIIAPNNSAWIDSLQILADWKTKKGVPCMVKNLQDIYNEYPDEGMGHPWQIKQFIQDMFNNSGTIWVLLGADHGSSVSNSIPCRGVDAHIDDYPNVEHETNMPCERYYEDVDGGEPDWDTDNDGHYGERTDDSLDWYADVYVGRMCAKSSAWAGRYVRSTLRFEKDPDNDFCKRAMFSSNILRSHPYPNVHGYARTDDWANQIPSSWEKPGHDTHPGYHYAQGIDIGNWPGDASFLGSAHLSDNEASQFHGSCGHGSADGFMGGWENPEFITSSEVNLYFNPGLGKGGIWTMPSCHTGAFDQYLCCAEYITYGRAVGGAFNSRYGWFKTNDIQLHQLSDGIVWQFFVQTFDQSSVYHLGEAVAEAKDYFGGNMDNQYWNWCLKTYNTFGDPELPMYTGSDVPLTLTVLHPSVVDPGENFTVNAGISEVRVCCWTPEASYYDTQTIGVGGTTASFTAPGSGDHILVTCTKHNYKAYEGVIWVGRPNAVLVDRNFNEDTSGWGYDRFDNIQDGIDAVAENGNVFVAPGVYNENVVIHKSLRLEGENKEITIIYGGGNGDVVKITANYVWVTGFTIRNSGFPHAGIYCVSVNHIEIWGNNIPECETGIWVDGFNINIFLNSISGGYYYGVVLVSGVDNILIWMNTITDFHNEGIHLYADTRDITISENTIENIYEHGIEIMNATPCYQNHIISDNEIINTGQCGIYVDDWYSNTISNNLIKNTDEYGKDGIGIHLVNGSNYSSISGNTIIGKDNGIELSYGSSADTISMNHIENNNIGINIHSDANTIYGNEILLNNDYGIYLSGADNTITENKIHRNDYGVYADGDACRNLFWNNVFLGNLVYNAYRDYGCGNFWDNGEVGNFWDDYDPVNPGDPYPIPGVPDPETCDSYDYHPLTNVAPVLDPIGNKSVYVNDLLEFNITASDPNENSLTLAKVGPGTVTSIGENIWKYSWTPSSTGTYTVTFTVTDDGNPPLSDSEPITITVKKQHYGCPYVFTWNGRSSIEDNNLLSLSELPENEGKDINDYYLLQQPLVPRDGIYRLEIREFENEHSWLDQLQLIAIDHPSEVRVAVSTSGKILGYRKLIKPISAVDSSGGEFSKYVSAEDGLAFRGKEGDEFTVNFGKVEGIKKVNLVIGGEISNYSKREPKHNPIVVDDPGFKSDAEVGISYRENKYAELVELPRDFTPEREIKVRLLWQIPYDLDFIGLIGEEDVPLRMQTCSLNKAVHSVNGSQLKSFLQKDQMYAELVPGQKISLVFSAPKQVRDYERDFVLVTTGNYLKIETSTPEEPTTGAQTPADFRLSQNYPNPFNPVTRINCALPTDCYVKLEIYNTLGQKVATLVDGEQKTGYKVARWDASSFSSGIYFYRLQAGDFVQTKVMVLIK